MSCSAVRTARWPSFGRRRGGSSAAPAEHPLLAEALSSLDRALIEASEAEDRITRAADALAFDPDRLDQVEARLFDIRGLARKHRVEPDALAALGEDMRGSWPQSMRAASMRPSSTGSWSRHARPIADAAARSAASGARRRPARRRGRRRAAPAEARFRAFPNRHRTAEPGPSGTDRSNSKSRPTPARRSVR